MFKREFILFCVVGLIGYLIDLFVVFSLKGILGFYGARIPSFLSAATVTWALNRRYTFIATSGKRIWVEYIHFLSLMGIGGCLNYLVYALAIFFLHDWQFGILIAVALGSLTGLAVNYLNSKNYVFKRCEKMGKYSG